MEDNKNIIILDNMAPVKFRIKQLMDKNDIKLYDANNSADLFNILSDNKNKIGLIIIDINIKEAGDGFIVLNEIRRRDKQIPIMILTSSSKRELFLKGIVLGANDYLLKPFEDGIIEKRILRYVKNNQLLNDNNKNNLNLNDEIGFINLEEYFSIETKKAKKGNYDVSVFMFTMFRPIEEITTNIENEYSTLCKDVFDELKSVFWDTDIFITYGSQCLLGIFPFCDENNVNIIEKKVNQKFSEIKSRDNKFQYYYLLNSHNTFPVAGDDSKKLIENLTLKMKDIISEFKDNLNS